jgi:hypothetical protein
MAAAVGDEPGGGWVEHELRKLPRFASDTQAPTLIVNREDGSGLDAPTEVHDPGQGAHARHRPRGSEHARMLRGAPALRRGPPPLGAGRPAKARNPNVGAASKAAHLPAS